MRRPVIGISAVTSSDEKAYTQRAAYAHAIWEAGGEAVLLPCNPDKSNCKQIVSILDGLLAPGGHDIDPQFYGEEVQEYCGTFTRYEDEYDMELVKEAVTLGIGTFISAIINFILVAFFVFLFVKGMNKLRSLTEKKKKEEEAAAPPPEPSKEEVLLTEIRDLLKEQKK